MRPTWPSQTAPSPSSGEQPQLCHLQLSDLHSEDFCCTQTMPQPELHMQQLSALPGCAASMTGTRPSTPCRGSCRPLRCRARRSATASWAMAALSGAAPAQYCIYASLQILLSTESAQEMAAVDLLPPPALKQRDVQTSCACSVFVPQCLSVEPTSYATLRLGVCRRAGSKINHSVIGLRTLINENCIIDDALIMGADYYETLEECALVPGCLPMGLGKQRKSKRS